MLFIQFWMFSKDFSSVMSYTRMMPWNAGETKKVKEVEGDSVCQIMPWAHHSSSVVCGRDGLKPLLSCRVPKQIWKHTPMHLLHRRSVSGEKTSSSGYKMMHPTLLQQIIQLMKDRSLLWTMFWQPEESSLVLENKKTRNNQKCLYLTYFPSYCAHTKHRHTEGISYSPLLYNVRQLKFLQQQATHWVDEDKNPYMSMYNLQYIWGKNEIK